MEAWAEQHVTVRNVLKLKDNEMLFCGMAVGYADPSKPENTLVSERNSTFVSVHSKL